MYVRLILTYPGIVKLILCIVNYFLAVSKEDVIVLVSMGVYSVKSHPLLFEKTTGKRGGIRASGAVGSRSEPPGRVRQGRRSALPHSKNFPFVTAK